MPCDFGAQGTHNICSVSCVIREDRSISAGLRDRSLTWTRACRQGWLHLQQRSEQDLWHNLIIHLWALKCVHEYASAQSHLRVPCWTRVERQSEVCPAFLPIDWSFLSQPLYSQGAPWFHGFLLPLLMGTEVLGASCGAFSPSSTTGNYPPADFVRAAAAGFSCVSVPPGPMAGW